MLEQNGVVFGPSAEQNDNGGVFDSSAEQSEDGGVPKGKRIVRRVVRRLIRRVPKEIGVPPAGQNGVGVSVPPAGKNGEGVSVPPAGKNGLGVSVPPAGKNGVGVAVPPAGQNGEGVSVPTSGQNGGGVSVPPQVQTGSASVPPTVQNGGGTSGGPPARQSNVYVRPAGQTGIASVPLAGKTGGASCPPPVQKGGGTSGPSLGVKGSSVSVSPVVQKGGVTSGPSVGIKGSGVSGSPGGQTGMASAIQAALQAAALQAEAATLLANRTARNERRRQKKIAKQEEMQRAALAKREEEMRVAFAKREEMRRAALANAGGVFGSSAPKPVSGNSIPPPSREANRYPILNSPLPMILISRILKGIPQSPHFLQLRRYSRMARTNLEAAWDRTFEEAVEQIHELRSPDFWAMAKKLWKTMEELQGLGYNVFVPRKRVVELTDAMLKQNKRQNEIMVLKARAELHRLEKSRLENAIRNLKAQARNAQDKMMETLNEAADKEKDLPEIETQIVDLASHPSKKRKLASI